MSDINIDVRSTISNERSSSIMKDYRYKDDSDEHSPEGFGKEVKLKCSNCHFSGTGVHCCDIVSHIISLFKEKILKMTNEITIIKEQLQKVTAEHEELKRSQRSLKLTADKVEAEYNYNLTELLQREDEIAETNTNKLRILHRKYMDMFKQINREQDIILSRTADNTLTELKALRQNLQQYSRFQIDFQSKHIKEYYYNLEATEDEAKDIVKFVNRTIEKTKQTQISLRTPSNIKCLIYLGDFESKRDQMLVGLEYSIILYDFIEKRWIKDYGENDYLEVSSLAYIGNYKPNHFVCSSRHDIYLFNLDGGSAPVTVLKHKHHIKHIIAIPEYDKRFLLMADTKSTSIYSIEARIVRMIDNRSPSSIIHLSSLAPYSLVVSGYEDGKIMLWDLDKGKNMMMYKTKLSSSITLTPLQGNLFASLNNIPNYPAGVIEIWSTMGNKSIGSFDFKECRILSMRAAKQINMLFVVTKVESEDKVFEVTMVDVLIMKIINKVKVHSNITDIIMFAKEASFTFGLHGLTKILIY